MNTLNKQVVLNEALNLMQNGATTTTYDVKMALRSKNYYATQNQISNYMQELANELDWNWINVSNYREYSLKDTPVSSNLVISCYSISDILPYVDVTGTPIKDTSIMYGNTKSEAKRYKLLSVVDEFDKHNLMLSDNKIIRLYKGKRFKRYLKIC